ncbi:MAG: diguanylate cyclase domain-containing protein [Spirulina sp.]
MESNHDARDIQRLPGVEDTLAHGLLGALHTPLWLYTLESLDLLWANQPALDWMGLQAVDEASAWMEDDGASWDRLLRCYRQALNEGQSLSQCRPVVSSVQGHSLHCLGTRVALADGQTGLLIEGHRLADSNGHPQAILNAIPDLLVRMTREGQCLYLVQGNEVVLWQDLNPDQRASIYDLLPPSLAEDRLHYTQQALETGDRQIYRQAIQVAGEQRYEEVRIVPMGEAEVLVMVRDITPMVDVEQKLQEQADRFRQQAQRDRVLAQVTRRISQSLDLQEVLDTAVAELRQMMQTQRVMVYQFEGEDGSGRVVAEAVSDSSLSLRQIEIEDRCFAINNAAIETYLKGHIHRVMDIHQDTSLSPCYVNMLIQLRVRANLVLPILQGDHLWGLLACQQCDGPRRWRDIEVETLAQLADQLAIAIQKSELYQQLQQANQELQHLATHDKLTSLANRRHFDDYLDQEWRRLTREQAPLSLILLDIDYFKRYNDTYGHLAGDTCIEKVAAAIRRSIKRPADLAARYGGEEFAIILPHTRLEGAIHTSQLILQEIANSRIPHSGSPSHPYVTVSLGIASTYPSLAFAARHLTDQADQALYQAKQQGRNRYAVAMALAEASSSTADLPNPELADSDSTTAIDCRSAPS